MKLSEAESYRDWLAADKVAEAHLKRGWLEGRASYTARKIRLRTAILAEIRASRSALDAEKRG